MSDVGIQKDNTHTYFISTILNYIDLHVQAEKILCLFSTNSSSKIAPSVATEAGLIFDFGASEKCPFRHEADHRREHRVVVLGGKALTNRDRWPRGAEQHAKMAPRAWIR